MDRLAARVVVIVVAYRNPDDVAKCLLALASASPEPGFEVFVSENGGSEAVNALLRRLLREPRFREAESYDLRLTDLHLLAPIHRLRCRSPNGGPGIVVNLAEMSDNLGYAGAVNAWLRPLLGVAGWEGAWILNPDTEPTPTALAELVAYAREHSKGMVGSRLMPGSGTEVIHSRGLAWRKIAARTEAVDLHVPAAVVPDPEQVERRLDSPSGASLYVTRALIEAIGLMDERYFLYFEDLEWGCRAKEHGGVGYAHASIVPHVGGTTTRSSCGDEPSQLAVYLEFRNRILFVRSRYPGWLPWTVTMQIAHAGSLFARGALRSAMAAARGVVAGLSGETGRPDHIRSARML